MYSLLRLGIFAVVLVILALAGMGSWLLVVVAALAAFFISYLTLNGPRTRAAEYLATRAEHRRSTGERFSRDIEDEAALEDAADDAARSGTATSDQSRGADQDDSGPQTSER